MRKWQNKIDHILQYAKKLGANEVATTISEASGFTVNVRLGEVDTIEHNHDKGVTISVYFGKRVGSASTNDLSVAALQLTVERACNIARFTEPDPYAGLADKELMADDYPDLDLYHQWDLTIEQAIELARQCEATGLAEDEHITNSEGVSVDNHNYYSIYGNSHGFIGGYPTSLSRISCVLLAAQNGNMQRDYAYTVARSADELDDIAVVAKHAAQRTLRRLGAETLTTRQCPVLFAADEAKGLLAAFISAISGSNLYRKSSFLLDHLHKKVFPDFIHIDERPHLLGGLGSAPFDSEGVATCSKDFISDGILQSYILGSYSARKLNMQTTGNAGGVYNLFINSTVECASQKQSNLFPTELLQLMHKGLLVTELMGHGINLVTGDFSCGAFGFWVENGEVQYPVEGITIAGNLKDMLLDIVAVGDDVDRCGNINTGSILIEKMTVAGG